MLDRKCIAGRRKRVCGEDITAGRRVVKMNGSGQLPGFLLGLQCRREREELSVEILGKD